MRRLPVLRTVAATLAASTILAVTSARTASAEAAGAASAPTVVLVHGAWEPASSWTAVAARLREHGYPVLVPDIPLRTLSGDVASIAAVREGRRRTDRPRRPLLRRLRHHRRRRRQPERQGARLHHRLRSRARRERLRPGSARTRKPPAGGHRPRAVRAARRQPRRGRHRQPAAVPRHVGPGRRAADGCGHGRSAAPGDAGRADGADGDADVEAIPSWYLVAREDRAIPPATQRFMAARARASTVEIDSSHAAQVAHPDAVTDLILAAGTAAAEPPSPAVAPAIAGLRVSPSTFRAARSGPAVGCAVPANRGPRQLLARRARKRPADGPAGHPRTQGRRALPPAGRGRSRRPGLHAVRGGARQLHPHPARRRGPLHVHRPHRGSRPSSGPLPPRGDPPRRRPQPADRPARGFASCADDTVAPALSPGCCAKPPKAARHRRSFALLSPLHSFVLSYS